MKQRYAVLVLAVLAGCTQQPSPVPAAAQPPAATPAAVAGLDADWQGLGPLQLGTSAEQLHQSWHGALEGEAVADGGCYWLTPVDQPDVALMVEDDTFARYDVEGEAVTAPGGGRNGMTLTQLQQHYPVAEVAPATAGSDGSQLRVPAADGSAAVLVFELGTDGHAMRWRVGQLPQAGQATYCQ